MFKVLKIFAFVFRNAKVGAITILIVLLYMSIIFEWHREVLNYGKIIYIGHLSTDAEIAELALDPNWQAAITKNPSTSLIVLESIATDIKETPIVVEDHDSSVLEEEVQRSQDTLLSLVEHKNANDDLLEKVREHIENINESSSCEVRSAILDRSDLGIELLVALSGAVQCGCEYRLKSANHPNMTDSGRVNILKSLIPTLNVYLENITVNNNDIECVKKAITQLDNIDEGGRVDGYKEIKMLLDLYVYQRNSYIRICKSSDISEHKRKLCSQYENIVDRNIFPDTSNAVEFVYKSN